jgi:hypothetical protein
MNIQYEASYVNRSQHTHMKRLQEDISALQDCVMFFYSECPLFSISFLVNHLHNDLQLSFAVKMKRKSHS